MKYIKTFEEMGEGAYSGPMVVNQASRSLVASGSDGFIGGGAGFGMTGAMGGEFPKKSGPTSTTYPDKYKYDKVRSKTKDTKRRSDAIKKLQGLKPSKMLDFEQDIKPKKSLKRFDEFEKDSK